MSDIEKLSLKELQALAKNMGLKGLSGLKKQELTEVIKDNIKKAVSATKAAKAKAQKTEKRVSDAKEVSKDITKENSGRKDEDLQETEERVETEENSAFTEKQAEGETFAHTSDEPAPEMTKEEREAEKRARRAAEDEAVRKRIEEFEKSKPVVDPKDKDSYVRGILEIMQHGFGFIRSENFLTGEEDVYVQNTFVKRYNLRNGDVVEGLKRRNRPEDKFMALIYLNTINGKDPSFALKRPKFENLTPIYPDERIRLERPNGSLATRIIDLISPIGKGQRGMIVAPPKAGKTTLLKAIANAVTKNNEDMHVIILLIDERPEEVTDIKESITGTNVDVIYSTFDEQPEHHKKVSEMVIEQAKRRVEMGQDVIILLDSITRLARAYNLIVQPSGRTLSGGLDPAALYMPKRFFGAARNMREQGSLTILATALVDTGSKMDDVVFEEFKGTGNMELILDRKLSEKRIFPAIDLAKSGTRRDDLLLEGDESTAMDIMHKALSGLKTDEAAERIIDLFYKTKSNKELTGVICNKNRV